MTDQPGSSARFQELLESALHAYESAHVTLANLGRPLAERLQTCHSVDDTTTLLQARAHWQAFGDPERDKIKESIRTTVSILTFLTPIPSVAYVADDAGLVSQNALMDAPTSLTILTDFTSTLEGNTRYSWNPTGRMYHSRLYVDILLMSKPTRQMVA